MWGQLALRYATSGQQRQRQRTQDLGLACGSPALCTTHQLLKQPPVPTEVNASLRVLHRNKTRQGTAKSSTRKFQLR